MKLQTKTGLIVVCVYSLASLASLFILRDKIISEFEQLETSQCKQDIDRVVEAMQQEARTLVDRVQGDWATWDDAYRFVALPYQEFIRSNLTYQVLDQVKFSHVGYLDTNLNLVYGVQLDREKHQARALSQDALNTLVTSQVFKQVLSGNHASMGGFVKIGDRRYLTAAAPITNSSGTADARGIVFLTRELDDSFIARIAGMTKINLRRTESENAEPIDYVSPILELDDFFSAPAFKRTLDSVEATLHVYDLSGTPFLSVESTFGREIFRRGIDTIAFVEQVLMGVFAITTLLVMFLMRSFVLLPIHFVVTKLVQISKHASFSERIAIGARDEIGLLTEQINDTLESLEAALTRAENAQHAAETANVAKSSFIARVSHELRTPIHSITGMLRILLREEKSSSKRNYITMARNSAYGLLETINEILDFSKVEAGKLTLENVEFSIHEVIRDSMQTIGPRIEEKGSLEAVVETCPGIPDKLFGDPLRLKQILVNLLGNATKFTKAGHIGLRVSLLEIAAERATVQLIISDTGIGIPADRLERIFEPFGQADESISRMFTGTGLGLTIVKQFVEAMEGTVHVESEFGVGSRFTITIPFKFPHESIPLLHRPALSSARVALVDGDSAAIKSFATELQRDGYTAIIIESENHAALSALRESIDSYGLVIVTSEALKRSRVFDLIVELRDFKNVPIVSVLSPFEISTRERLLALNVPYVVTRPVSLFDIFGVLTGQVAMAEDCWQDSEDESLKLERPLEVLVADDAQTNRIILTELLRDAGHHVVCVENGEDLVSRVRESFESDSPVPKFDIILTDVQMPLLDGLSATAMIRSIENELGRGNRLPIVAVTAHAMTDAVSRMRQFGVDDVVTKPLDPLRLGSVIRKLTGREAPNAPMSVHTVAEPVISAERLRELGLSIWSTVARHGEDISELFQLAVNSVEPHEFKKVLDIDDVMERAGESIRRTLLIFGGFTECFGEQLQKLREAKQREDSNNLQFVAHALKGLLLDVGARTSSTLASSIEQMCKEGASKEAFELVNKLTKQVLIVARLVDRISSAASGIEDVAGSYEEFRQRGQ